MKKQKASKTFYQWAKEFKEGVEPDNGKATPTLDEFKQKAEEKLRNLNPGDRTFSDKTIEQIYGREESEKVTATFPSKKAFIRIILSTSNSGARDHRDFSLKITKALIKKSKGARDFLHVLMRAMAHTEYTPKEWKIDLITFLYKRKGRKCDPKNWRPITIAACYGKHFEKISLAQLRKIDDLNPDNHAYIIDKSCLTAVLEILEFMKALRGRDKEARREGYMIVCLLYTSPSPRDS